MADLDLRSGLGAIRALGEKPPEPEAAPVLVARELTVRVKYSAPDGKVYEGTVISRIPTAGDRAHIARATQALVGGSGGVWASLPLETQAYISALALVSVQLRNPPDWIDRWAGEDDALLSALYEACLGHASRYFRRDEGAGAPGAERPRVVVSPVDASPAG